MENKSEHVSLETYVDWAEDNKCAIRVNGNREGLLLLRKAINMAVAAPRGGDFVLKLGDEAGSLTEITVFMEGK